MATDALPPSSASSSPSSSAPTDRRRLPWPAVGVAALLAGALLWRVLLRDLPPWPDESGFYLVGRHWDPSGPAPYGRYWVDRPPGLVAIFASTASWAGLGATRIAAALAALLAVAVLCRAVHRRGGRVLLAGAVGTVLACTPQVQAPAAFGETFALSFVAVGVGCALGALTAPRRRAVLLAVLGGAAGAAAAGIKQNQLDALVFGGLLLAGAAVTGAVSRRRALGLLGALGAGALLVVAGFVVLAAQAPGGIGATAYAAVGFRADASAVLLHAADAPVRERAARLLGLAFSTGLVPLLVVSVAAAFRRRARSRPAGAAFGLALAGSALVELAGVALGGGYWPHYLVQLVPVAVLGAGTMAWSRLVRGVAVLTVVSGVASAALFVAGDAAGPLNLHDLYQRNVRDAAIGAAVRDAARPGDTLTVLYGHAGIQLASGLDSPYRHLWSLPVRVMDPHTRQLRAVLGGPERPTWVVPRLGPGAFGLDSSHELRRALAGNYEPAGRVCGVRVLVLRGVPRHLHPAQAHCHEGMLDR